MTFEEYRQLDGLALAGRVKSGAVEPQQLVELAIQRAEAVDPEINAIVHPAWEEARQMAGAVDRAAIFAGVPFLIKDLGLHVEGWPKREGSKALEGVVSPRDSYLVERFRRAGLVFLGKTNTPEYGVTPFTEPRHFGPTRNPWDPERSAGGSSGGSAAAVAAGIVPLATASDGGGSIRIPASCNGLFGLKPSRGRLTFGPFANEHWMGATSEGCVSRSVRDTAAFLDAVAGPGPGDPYYLPQPETPFLKAIDRLPQSLRVGWSVAHPLGHELDVACADAVRETVGLLRELGHRPQEVELPIRRTDFTEIFIVMVAGAVAANIKELEGHLGRSARVSDVEPHVWLLNLLGKTFTAGEFARARRRWNEIGRRLARFFEDQDLLLTPTAAMRPFPVGALQPQGADKQLIRWINRMGLGRLAKANIEKLADKVYSYIPYTPLANMAGSPSMSVPLHWTAEGLPVGVMFTGPIGEDARLLQLAAQLEAQRPWMDKVPVLG